jgi:hypothetical protein
MVRIREMLKTLAGGNAKKKKKSLQVSAGKIDFSNLKGTMVRNLDKEPALNAAGYERMHRMPMSMPTPSGACPQARCPAA